MEKLGYLTRLDRLKTSVRNAEPDLFIVSAFDSIFYLTGAGYEPLERPYFLIVRPDGNLAEWVMDRHAAANRVAGPANSWFLGSGAVYGRRNEVLINNKERF